MATIPLSSTSGATSYELMVRHEKHRVADTIKQLYDKHDIEGCSELLGYLLRSLRAKLCFYDSDSDPESDSDSEDKKHQRVGAAPDGETITCDDGKTTIVLEATPIGKFAQSGLLEVILKIAKDEDAYNLDKTMESDIRRVKLERREAEVRRRADQAAPAQTKKAPIQLKPKTVLVKHIAMLKAASDGCGDEVAPARPKPPTVAVAKPIVPPQEQKEPKSVTPPVFNDGAFRLIADALASLNALCQWLRHSRRHYERHVRMTTLSFATFWKFLWNSWSRILENIPSSDRNGRGLDEQEEGLIALGEEYVDSVNRARQELKQNVADLTRAFWKMEGLYSNRSQPECEEHLKVALYTWLQARRSCIGALYVVRKQLQRNRAARSERFKMTTVVTAVLSRHLGQTCTLVEAVQALLPILDDAIKHAAYAWNEREMLDIMILYAESLGFEGVTNSLVDVEAGVPSNEDHLGAVAEAVEIASENFDFSGPLCTLVVEILCLLTRNFDHPNFDRSSILKCVELACRYGDKSNKVFKRNCATLKRWICVQTGTPPGPRKGKSKRGKKRAATRRPSGLAVVPDRQSPAKTPVEATSAADDSISVSCAPSSSRKRKRTTTDEEGTPEKRRRGTDEEDKPVRRRRSLRLLQKGSLIEHEDSASEFEGDISHHSYDLRPRPSSLPATPEKKKKHASSQ